MLLQKYIDRFSYVIGLKDIDAAKKLGNEIVSVLGKKLKDIRTGL